MGFLDSIKKWMDNAADTLSPKMPRVVPNRKDLDKWLEPLKQSKDEYDLQGRKLEAEQQDGEREEEQAAMEMKEDKRYYGEAYLVNLKMRKPKLNDIVLVPRKEDGKWVAASVEEVDPKSGAVRCRMEWHSDFVFYKYNEELVGTARKPKDPKTLQWGDKVLVCDDLKDEPEEAIFLGFNEEGESDLRWLTLSSAKKCLESFRNGKWLSFGHWKYMWLADKPEK